MATGFVWHERYMWHDTGSGARADVEPGEHFEHPETKRRLKNLLDVTGLSDALVMLKPRAATEEEIRRVHSAAYLARIREMSEGFGGDAGDETPFGPGSYEIAQLAAGGTIVALDAVMEGRVANAYALVRPPGHHAERDRGRGFCIFANVAIAVHHARIQYGIERVATIDWDVHHGNGTEQAFYDDPHVLTISLHQDRLYPRDSGDMDARGRGPGEGANINVPLPPGSGRGAYLAAMERVVEPAVTAFRPELIVVPCGFDASWLDPLGRMLLTAEAYRELTARLMALADATCGGRLVLSHEGGYSKRYVPFCGLAVIEQLSGVRTEVVDGYGRDDMPGQELQPHQAERIAAIAALVGAG